MKNYYLSYIEINGHSSMMLSSQDGPNDPIRVDYEVGFGLNLDESPEVSYYKLQSGVVFRESNASKAMYSSSKQAVHKTFQISKEEVKKFHEIIDRDMVEKKPDEPGLGTPEYQVLAMNCKSYALGVLKEMGIQEALSLRNFLVQRPGSTNTQLKKLTKTSFSYPLKDKFIRNVAEDTQSFLETMNFVMDHQKDIYFGNNGKGSQEYEEFMITIKHTIAAAEKLLTIKEKAGISDRYASLHYYLQCRINQFANLRPKPELVSNKPELNEKFKRRWDAFSGSKNPILDSSIINGLDFLLDPDILDNLEITLEPDEDSPEWEVQFETELKEALEVAQYINKNRNKGIREEFIDKYWVLYDLIESLAGYLPHIKINKNVPKDKKQQAVGILKAFWDMTTTKISQVRKECKSVLKDLEYLANPEAHPPLDFKRAGVKPEQFEKDIAQAIEAAKYINDRRHKRMDEKFMANYKILQEKVHSILAAQPFVTAGKSKKKNFFEKTMAHLKEFSHDKLMKELPSYPELNLTLGKLTHDTENHQAEISWTHPPVVAQRVDLHKFAPDERMVYLRNAQAKEVIDGLSEIMAVIDQTMAEHVKKQHGMKKPAKAEDQEHIADLVELRKILEDSQDKTREVQKTLHVNIDSGKARSVNQACTTFDIAQENNLKKLADKISDYKKSHSVKLNPIIRLIHQVMILFKIKPLHTRYSAKVFLNQGVDRIAGRVKKQRQHYYKDLFSTIQQSRKEADAKAERPSDFIRKLLPSDQVKSDKPSLFTKAGQKVKTFMAASKKDGSKHALFGLKGKPKEEQVPDREQQAEAQPKQEEVKQNENVDNKPGQGPK